MRHAVLVWGVLLTNPMSLSAQRADSLPVVSDSARSEDVPTLLLAGTAGMITGAFAGGLIGSRIDAGSGLDDADGAVIGGLTGVSLLIPTAVHLANGSRGNLGRSVLVSTLVGGAMLALGATAESGEIILAIPFILLFTSMSIELETGRRPH